MNLLDMLPEFYSASREIVDIQNAISAELDKIIEAKNDCFLQLDVNRATWGLALWEQAYGIKTDVNLSDAIRRAQIKAKMGGAGTTKCSMIESVARNYTDGDVIVEEIAKEYRFKIKYIDTFDFLPDMKTLVRTIEEIKPAHLAYEISVAIALMVFLNRHCFSAVGLELAAGIEEKTISKVFTWNELDKKGWDFNGLDAQQLDWYGIAALTPEKLFTNKLIVNTKVANNNLFSVAIAEE